MAGTIFQPLDIVTYETDQPGTADLDKDYVGLVFVEAGQGARTWNNETIAFQTGDLFMHHPDANNCIVPEPGSRLHVIKFRQLLTEAGNHPHVLSFTEEQFRKLEFILYSGQEHQPSLIHLQSDKVSVFALFNVLLTEATHRRSYADSNITLCVLALLNMAARNILESSYVQAMHPLAITHDVLHYINYHIYEPWRLSVQHLAGEFNIEVAAFPDYFRQQYSVPLDQYILRYKIRLADTRLRYTKIPLASIAADLHFDSEDELVTHYKSIEGQWPPR
ncbi:helix-turn-helix domain-containing protein [Paraflavitalea pollutisoli]|uniref:helix-turn-helix domain-containing protein n=1 Tax=Paraflavitalea pollutisoli TaxID=3034143 RepID=UPI0023EC561B|nr:AraC family transcriptional regulator [Paraflavitalea sp. H1-2-19X]